MKPWLRRNRLPLIAFAVALCAYGATAGKRLQKQSADPHFVVQAQAWLDGRLSIDEWPARADDPAKVEVVELDDGSEARGRRIASKGIFRKLGGDEIPLERVKRTVTHIHYVSFPPFPAVLMLPQVALLGPRVNDVTTTVFFAALIPAFFLVLLRRLREEGLSTRTAADDVWLTILLCFGTVLYFSAVQGRVWFTAHTVAVLLCVLYAWASIGARHPLLAGLFLGCAFVTRAPTLFMFPLFAFEAWRAGRESFVKRGLLFAAPVAAIGLLAAWHNFARFEEITEFGHSYLAVRQQAQIERFGLFDWQYLSRNLSVALTLLPKLTAQPPYLKVSGHGLALWVTTPAFLLLPWPRERNRLHLALWLTVAAVAPWSLFYQNSGWIQFGYRFSLDYTVFLVLLLAVGGRRMTRWLKALIVLGVVVNLFGAVTFHRHDAFYDTSNEAYRCVVPH